MTKTELQYKKAIGVAVFATSEEDKKQLGNVAPFSIYEILEIDLNKNRVYYALNCGERHAVCFTKLRKEEETGNNFILINKQPFFLKDMHKGLTWSKSL
ncbi:hypothetical protein FGBNBECL_00004 [Enterococcus phage vB_OCPT_Bob]|uniref:Uncharacterized protein n=1 Tax=Enterococcus phage vB_OCPT_Bob TaxID=2922318 RepID=A0A9E7DTY3_9CAUD|nr:hypothetical protein FGBNBECL_00004 [Enterococcus phage vB_OCPT_Bob]